MDIELVSPPEGEIVAWEVQLGKREGRFTVGADGCVSYQSPFDTRTWHAGTSIEQFHACAEAWNTYTTEGKGLPEEVHPVAVARLRAFFEQTGVLRAPQSVWPLLLEQAEDGFL